ASWRAALAAVGPPGGWGGIFFLPPPGGWGLPGSAGSPPAPAGSFAAPPPGVCGWRSRALGVPWWRWPPVGASPCGGWPGGGSGRVEVLFGRSFALISVGERVAGTGGAFRLEAKGLERSGCRSELRARRLLDEHLVQVGRVRVEFEIFLGNRIVVVALRLSGR